MAKEIAAEDLNLKVDELTEEDEAQVKAYSNVQEAMALAKEDGVY
jgi:hypothetical protein